MDVYSTAHRGSNLGANRVWVGRVCGRTHYTDRWDARARHCGIWVGRVCGCLISY